MRRITLILTALTLSLATATIAATTTHAYPINCRTIDDPKTTASVCLGWVWLPGWHRAGHACIDKDGYAVPQFGQWTRPGYGNRSRTNECGTGNIIWRWVETSD